MKERKEINIEIGKRIRHSRETAGYTQESLAEKIEVTTQYISDLERGVVGASVTTITRICKELDVSSDYILLGRKEILTPEVISRLVADMSEEQLEIVVQMLGVLSKAMSIKK